MSHMFCISDLHMYHKKVMEFEPKARPFSSLDEMHEYMTTKWNSVVGKRDTVMVVGDVCFGRPSNLELLDNLNGTKQLIMGNHDEFPILEYTKKFSKVFASRKYDNHILTHIPIHHSQFYRFTANVHGHLHSKVVQRDVEVETGIGMMHETIPDPRYFNVSCERLDFVPMEWSEIKSKIKEALCV